MPDLDPDQAQRGDVRLYTPPSADCVDGPFVRLIDDVATALGWVAARWLDLEASWIQSRSRSNDQI